ncbi:purine permease 21-like [Coffea arabica]|uniref:Probable purine permease n=1 Tax=Coffea arabica TaxID=13443 RepID=A0A6P6U827_COFAR|nr:purine permease 21-like [Coffea arabica]
MEEARKQPSCTTSTEAKEILPTENIKTPLQSNARWLRTYKWWFQVAIYILFLLSGQAVGTLLGRLYFDKGGNSTWLATLTLTMGFPMLLPFRFHSSLQNHNADYSRVQQPSVLVLTSIYVFLGLCTAGDSVLYSLGLKYLPVSTYSLICASQLAFNAVFAFFLNAQKLTFFIINSLVLLTISSIVLVIHNDTEDSSNNSKNKYTLGIICTVAASALYAFVLSFTELTCQKILKSKTFRVIIDLTFYESLVATLAIVVGLFASGEWKSLKSEMQDFRLGKVSYIMTILWTGISWQVFNIGCNGLIFKVSSLFSNVISVVGLPVDPVLAVVVFHDKVTAAKVVSLLLALWGFMSYAYQHYLDDLKAKAKRKCPREVTEDSITEI